jgi:hypothetical protein
MDGASPYSYLRWIAFPVTLPVWDFFHRLEMEMINYYDDIGFDPWLSYEECCKIEIGLKYFDRLQRRVGDIVLVRATWPQLQLGKVTTVDPRGKFCFVRVSGSNTLKKFPLTSIWTPAGQIASYCVYFL